MCGIAIQYKSGFCNPSKISHRGVKKTTVEFLDYSLTHFKLPFQTLLDDEYNQPIKLSNGNYLLFNGEIFNIPKNFKNDVQYLINFFEKDDWLENIGGSEYNEWDGFWAICIVTSKGIYAFTDPLGKKQLYYNTEGCIASEIKPILKEDFRDYKFNQVEVEQTSLTPFQWVYRLEPNKLYYFDGTVPKKESKILYDLKRAPKSNNLFELMKEAVQVRLINNFDSNTLLISGGLDSTIILGVLFELGVIGDFQLLAIENQNDSFYLPYIEDYYKCEIEIISKPDLKNLQEVQSIIKSYEYPIEKGSLYQQSRLIQFSRGSVIFTGDGADELFSGYSRAQIKDTQNFDVFTELPYYHNIRLDRMGMMFTKEIRNPFLSHEIVRYAMNLKYESRRGKKILKEVFGNIIPNEILSRTKTPLRNEKMSVNKTDYQNEFNQMFNQINFSK